MSLMGMSKIIFFYDEDTDSSDDRATVSSHEEKFDELDLDEWVKDENSDEGDTPDSSSFDRQVVIENYIKAICRRK